MPQQKTATRTRLQADYRYSDRPGFHAGPDRCPMMWRGEMFSTLLHGSIVVAIVGGLPLLPNIFDRTEEPETESALGGGSLELPISIEIVSANSVDLQQNVITRRNRGSASRHRPWRAANFNHRSRAGPMRPRNRIPLHQRKTAHGPASPTLR